MLNIPATAVTVRFKAKTVAAALAATMPFSAPAATVAIIDSGVDNQHATLFSQMWTNTGEAVGNGLDDDGNGFVDDLYGWNFTSQDEKVIDRSYLGTFSDVPARFFALQEKALLGTISNAEKDEMKELISKRKNMREIQKFGNFVHGTHVTGIAAQQSPSGLFMALKIIPTEVKLPFAQLATERGYSFPLPTDWKDDLRELVLKTLLGLLAQTQGIVMKQVGTYIANTGAEVANGSFGVSAPAVQPLLTTLLRLALGRDATAEELTLYTDHFITAAIKAQAVLVDSCPETFFVFAAGNDGVNNDERPVSPANIKRENSIAVAATIGDQALAPFSNYGRSKVEVAAPGTAILSTIPGDESFTLSGTSQAAPFVAGVAAEMKTINPELSPAETKVILIKTVEKMSFLEGKVKSGGMVHRDRALLAAAQARQRNLDDAITSAFKQIPTGRGVPGLQPLTLSIHAPASASDVVVLPLPSPFR